jgi:V8-like Glu-specific endopeptidase
MKIRLTASALALGWALAGLSAAPASAEEGMWTFDNFPIARVNQTYGTNIDQAWLDRVREASVRLRGCSASFVSPDGLILTNHHCVVSCVQELSTAEQDFVANGFLVATREEERTCPGQTAEVLTEIVDVTDRVLGAGAGLEGAAFTAARTAEINRIQQEACAGDERFTCQVISFYRGGRYGLYKFRRYDDVRLAFAPEFQAAFFGGDPDNFNFPRYALDAAFLRAYENGQPVSTPNHLTWNPRAPRAGEPTFVSGNPGTTQRLLTVAQLERLRDQQLPLQLIQGSELRGRLLTYAASGDEAARVSVDPIFGLENSFKVWYGQQQALLDPAFMAEKRAQEAELRERVAADPALQQRIGDPWSEIEAAEQAARELAVPFRQIVAAAGGGSTLYGMANAIVGVAKERAKPEGQRNPGLEAAVARTRTRLQEETPLSADLEEIRLGFWLSKTREYLTVDDARVRALLGRESPEGLAERAVANTRMDEPAFRAAALDMTVEQLAALNDPMIDLALRNYDQAAALQAEWGARVGVPSTRAAERVAQARFAVYGDNLYPDATFSLRLSYGSVQGWSYRGVEVPAFTYMGGLFDRATGAAPFNAAEDFLAARERIDPEVVYNYVTTNDIIGGNSGSPVVDAEGQVIGAAFDGNIHSLGGSFGYDGSLNRTVVVSTAAVTEALRKVYNQPHLLRELGVD